MLHGLFLLQSRICPKEFRPGAEPGRGVNVRLRQRPGLFQAGEGLPAAGRSPDCRAGKAQLERDPH